MSNPENDSPLDRPMPITFFKDRFAAGKTEESICLRKLVDRIATTRAPSKERLPWLKLAEFGDIRTEKRSLRHDANVLAISGIEADYDGEAIPLDHARAILDRAGIASLLYTSPSHTAERPRWRVLCPTSMQLPATERTDLVARLNGLFGGRLAGESFGLSQAYYFGGLPDASDHSVTVVEGTAIDLVPELDSRAIGRTPQAAPPPPAPRHQTMPRGSYGGGRREMAALASACSAIRGAAEGEKHHTIVREAYAIGGYVTGADLPEGEAFAALTDALHDMAARGTCKDLQAAQRTLRGQFELGKSRPRLLPERAEPPPVDSSELMENMRRQASTATAGQAAAHDTTPQPSALQVLTVLTPDQCEAQPARDYLVKGLISRGDHVGLIGQPGAGKSLLGPFIGYAVAQGREIFGRRVRQGPVLYIGAEDAHGMTMRVRALRRRFGEAPEFYLLPMAVDLLDPKCPHLAQVKALVERLQPAVTFLDTVARCFPGLKENDAEDMARVVKIARTLADITPATPTAVVSIHHVAKDEGSTPRGHGVLNGDMDVTILVRGAGSEPRIASLGKNRNGPSDGSFTFTIGVEQLGEDADGDPITAPVAEAGEGDQRRRPQLTPTERKARGYLADLLCEQGQPLPAAPGFPPTINGLCTKGVDEDAWRAACESRRLSTADTLKDRGRAFRRIYTDLLNKSVVCAADGLVWLRESPTGAQ